MPLYLSEADVRATLPMQDAIDVVEAAARRMAEGSATNAPRQRVSAGGATLHLLAAALDGRVGHKAYTVGPRGVHFWMTLYDRDGTMLALIEANALGQIRTGAASGVATRYLARADARTLVSIGTGFQARTQIEAVCLVRPIEAVRVWGRNPDRVAAFCADVSHQLDRAVEPIRDLAAALERAAIVSTMTSATHPLFAGELLAAGTHVNAAGSNRATAAEIDVETVRRATVVVVEDVAQAQIESGDLLAAVRAEAFAWTDAVRLSDIVAGRRAGRSAATDITLFESLGVGMWDLAAASHVFDACLRDGRGTDLPIKA